MRNNDSLKSLNQLRVEKFMALMHASKQGQESQPLPVKPTVPSASVRVLRAALILEEVFETIEALGVSVRVKDDPIDFKALSLTCDKDCDLAEVLDGLADIEVVSTGTASTCGLALQPGFDLAMDNNMLKFAPGHSFNALGKLVKPSDHVRPDFSVLVKEQS